MSINTLPDGLLEAVKKHLQENPEQVDPQKMDPDLDGVPGVTAPENMEDAPGKETPLKAEPSNLEPEKAEKKLKEHIVKLANGKYRLLSHEGKNLGTFDSHEAAAKHEGQVKYFKAHESFVTGEPTMLKPASKELDPKKDVVSAEPSKLDPKEAAKKLQHESDGEHTYERVHGGEMLLEPQEKEEMYEATPPGMESWVTANKARFKKEYGDRWQEVLYATAWAMKDKKESVEEDIGNYSDIVKSEPTKLDPEHAEKMLKMKEEDEEEKSSDEQHGDISTGKVANLDGIARESVEDSIYKESAKKMGLVKEEADSNLDTQTSYVVDHNKPPKLAHVVYEEGRTWKGMRLQLSFASGRTMILPEASEAPLEDLAAVFEYVEECFASRPEWIEIIERWLIDG